MTTNTIDCRSKIGLTIGLIDSLMSISGSLIDRLMIPYDLEEHKLIEEALSDLKSDPNLKRLLATAR